MKTTGMSRNFVSLIVCVTLAISWIGCDSGVTEEDLITAGVIVANQGNFNEGTGSVTAYDPDTGVSSTLAENFGSIVQSVSLKGDTLYVMANTASRIDVLNVETGAQIGQVQNVVSPRYMTVVGQTGYVTNLSDDPGGLSGGSISIVNLTTNTVVDTVQVGENPEGVLVVGPRIFVANNGFGSETTVSIISQTSQSVVATVDVNCWGPRFLALDAEAEIYVFCQGRTIYDEDFNPVEEIDGEVVVIDGATVSQVARVPVDGKVQSAGGVGQDIFHSPETNEIFFVRDGNTILCFDTGTNAVVEEIAIQGDPIGAIAFDYTSDTFYLGRVPGFDQTGTVTMHDRNGNQTGSFAAGIAPGHIVFVREVE